MRVRYGIHGKGLRAGGMHQPLPCLWSVGLTAFVCVFVCVFVFVLCACVCLFVFVFVCVGVCVYVYVFGSYDFTITPNVEHITTHSTEHTLNLHRN